MISKLDNLLIKQYKKLIRFKDKILKKLLLPLGKIGFSADLLSFIGLFFGIVSAFYITESRRYFFIFWLIKHIADILDGPLSQLNNKKIIKFLDVDRFCDNTYSFILYFALMLRVNFWLALGGAGFHAMHILLNYKEIRRSIFAPASIAQIFFVFGFYELGLVVQMFYSGFSVLYNLLRK
ncbi:MAG: hypothetical protein PHS44_03140 [Candidatus Dojkabacteria bacterium]|nr:hypothetical protein [Candidatus Dojkabacteria bacterium]